MKRFNISRLLFAIAAVIAFAIPAAAQEQADTTGKSTELQEVVIEGRTRKAIDNGFLIVPSEKDKKFATTAYELLQNIQMPGIRVEGTSVSNAVNSPVALYINYQSCSNLEAKTLQAKDVIRVEYLESPDDPRFAGEQFVLNFIVKEYIYGGYTTLQAKQSFYDTWGEYLAASKFTYKKTDINLFVGDEYKNDVRNGDENIETFRDIKFNDAHYDEITRKAELHGHEKSNTAYATLIIRNRLKGMNSLKHVVAFNAFRQPQTTSSGTTVYSPQIADQDLTLRTVSAKNLSPSIFGDYFFGAGMNYFNISWSALYLDNKSRSNLKQVDFSDIIDNVEEKAAQGKANVTYTRYLNNSKLETVLSTDIARYKTDYSGSTESSQKLFRTSNNLNISYLRQFTQALIMRVTAGVNLFTSKINDLGSDISWTPKFQAYLGWTINRNHRLTFIGDYSSARVPTQYLADLMVRKDPLVSQMGNPDLKNRSKFQLSFSYTWMPNDKFNLTLTPTLTFSKNDWASYWTANPTGDGVCQYFLNSDYNNGMLISADLSWRPLSILSFSGRLVYFHEWMKGPTKEVFDFLEGNLSSRIYLGNFSIDAYMTSPYTRYSYGYHYLGVWQWGLGGSYSVGNFSCSVRAYNPFLSNRNKWKTYSSPYYSYETWTNSTRSGISVSLSYTFTYGKKVNNDGTWGGRYSMGSSVLRSDEE